MVLNVDRNIVKIKHQGRAPGLEAHFHSGQTV